MKLTPLGVWAPYPRAGGACSGYLLRGQGNLLLDCGNGVLSNLQKHLDFRNLDAVFISHLHPDHYLDLFSLRHAIEGALRDGSRKTLLPLYLPGTPENAFEQVAKMDKAFEVIRINSGEVVQVAGSSQIDFLPTEHALETYGIKVTEDNKTFGYTADTKYFHRLPEFFEKCDLLLSEASVLEKDKEYAQTGHLTVSQAAELGRQAQVEKLVITHFWPEYNLDQILREAQAVFTCVEMAKEGKDYTL